MIVTLINDSVNRKSIIKFGDYEESVFENDKFILLQTLSPDSWILGMHSALLGQDDIFLTNKLSPRTLLIEPQMPLIHVPIRDFAKIKGFIQQSIGFGSLECDNGICYI